MTPLPLPLRFSLYVDEDSHALVLAELLRTAGMDVVRSTDAGMDAKKDEEQLMFATRAGRAIYTANSKDYARLHRDFQRSERNHAGIIIWVRRRHPIPEQARRLIRLWENLSIDDMRNRQEFLSQWGEPAER